MSRIVVVAPDLPNPPLIGFHQRVLSVLEALSTRHQVTVVGSAPADADLSLVRARCHDLVATTIVQNTALIADRRRPRVVLSRLRSLLLPLPTIRASYSPAIGALVEAQIMKATRPDVVHLESFHALHYAPSDVPVVASLHDVFSDYCREARAARPIRYCLAPLQGRAYARSERRRLSTPAAVITINDRDRDLLAERGIKAATVPFAVGLPPVAPQRASGDHVRLLFVGTFETRANQDTVRYIERELAPALDRSGTPYRLTIAGRKARPLSRRVSPRITYVADPPLLEEFYRDTDVVLAPIPYGGGTKTKTLEAMSYSRPLVGTPSAFTGIEAQSGDTHLECPLDAEALADAVAGLAGDPAARERLGLAARRYVEAHHTQAAVDKALARVYDDLLRDRAPR